MTEVALSIENLSKSYQIAHERNGAANYRTLHDEIVGLPKIPLNQREMRTIALSGKTNRNFVGDELLSLYRLRRNSQALRQHHAMQQHPLCAARFGIAINSG